MSRLRDHVDRVARLRGRRDALLRQVEETEGAIQFQEEKIVRTDNAVMVMQAAIEVKRQELHDRVESLVTRGIRAVFDREDYEFTFKVTMHGDRFGVKPMLRSNFQGEVVETEIVGGHGGGVADVISFLLRVVVLSMARPRLRPVMLLDEAFRHVSPDFLRGVAVLLKELNDSAGIQFVLVTHKEELLDAADVIYRAELDNGKTTFSLEHDMQDELAHQAPRRTDGAARPVDPFHGKTLARAPKDPQRIEGKTTDPAALKERHPRAKIKNRTGVQKRAAKTRRKAKKRAKRKG